MSARAFFTAPGEVWLRDAGLNGCTEDGIAIFQVICQSSDRDWRLEVSPDNHAFSVRQCLKAPNRFRRWSEERIHRALCELRARGCLLLATANGREWLEVADRLAYCKGHKKEHPLAPLAQVPLALKTPPDGTLPLFALPDIGVRAEGEKSKAPESRASEARGAALPPGGGNRDMRLDSEKAGNPARFATPIEAITATTLGRRLNKFLGMAQMVTEAQRSGAEWLRILREEGPALEDALEQGERCAGELGNGLTRAKFLTKRLAERRAA